MKKQLITIAITSTLLAGTSQYTYASEQEVSNNKHKQYIGTGIGATAGALVAGPVGFIVGGLIGNLAGRHDAMDDHITTQSPAADEPVVTEVSQPVTVTTTENQALATIVVAQADDTSKVINDDNTDQSSELKDIIIENLSLDVLFLSGSTSIEEFYKSRLESVAKLMQIMPDIDIQLEGYSDRRGDEDTNLALSSERLVSVRNELVQAGIDESRIHMNAFGEQQFASRPGDLEAYTFDRRVVIRFEYLTPVSKSPVASIESTSTL
jgi:sortase system peptidoglycan-associated protein